MWGGRHADNRGQQRLLLTKSPSPSISNLDIEFLILGVPIDPDTKKAEDWFHVHIRHRAPPSLSSTTQLQREARRPMLRSTN
ncbi:hypothetical protein B5V90_02255 [Heyndrickxia sporothermodurans]|nr:hypothetical protein B5V90_02255 [Heyndrickxia sporothermodurans]